MGVAANLSDEFGYKEPEKFKPERWLRSEGSQNINKFTTISLGHGPRMCIGKRFAEQEIHLALISVSFF